jgi:small subunit ribosomal protein S7
MNKYSEKSIIKKISNRLMFSGKRSKATKLLNNSILYIKNQGYENPIEIIINAVNNTQPLLDLRSIRKSGSTYQIPVPIPRVRQESLAISWIVDVARKRSEKSLEIRLAKEFLEAYNNRGNSIKKRDALHKIGQANRAFAHFRWQ